MPKSRDAFFEYDDVMPASELGTLEDDDLEILRYEEPPGLPFVPRSTEDVVIDVTASDTFAATERKKMKEMVKEEKKRGDTSKAIRKLFNEGKSTSEIAQELGILYQHAYNVVRDYKQRRGLL